MRSHSGRDRLRQLARVVSWLALCAILPACEGRGGQPNAGTVRGQPSEPRAPLVIALSDGTALNAGPSRPSVAARAAERKAREALALDAGSTNWHVWGQRLIVIGEYNAAVDALEEALRIRPTAAVLQDLAAARILTAAASRAPDDWVRALDAALAADLADRQSSAGAAAVAHAWRGWLGHARPRPSEALTLAIVESRQTSGLLALARVDVQGLREWVEDAALPGWADAHLAGQPSAATRWLEAARRVADAIHTASGDTTDRDAVESIARATADRRASLARLHVTWRTGRRQFAQDAMSDMRLTFQALRVAAPTHPLAGWAGCYEAIGRYYEGDVSGAEAMVATTMQSAPSAARSLRARLLWLRGTLHFHQARFERAAADYAAASASFASIPEPANVATVEHLLADAYASLGDTPRVWQHFAGALAAMPRHPEARRRFAAWTGAGVAAETQGLRYAAAAFFERALGEARLAGTAAAMTDALHRVALARHRLGRGAAAREAITAAAASAALVTDPGLRAKFGADLLSSQALLALDSAPGDAERLATQALASHRHVGSTFALVELRLLIARAQRAQARSREAERTLAEALREIEARRQQTHDAELRLSYLQAYWRGYGDMVAVQADDLARPADALGTAERARARGLLELTSGGASPAVRHPLTVSRHLPRATKVLYLATTESHTYAWVLGTGPAVFRRLDIGRSEAARLIARLQVYMAEGRGAEADLMSTHLHRIVISPFREVLVGTDRLIVVADPIWQAAPFAALRASVASPYLADTLAVSFSPSVSVLRLLRARPAVRVPRIAVFAAGTPPAGVSLPSLPSLERESRHIVRLYAAAEVYSGAEATRGRFLAALGTRQVVHFAGHALRSRPGERGSTLVFADGQVSVRDIEGASIRASVVVLAGCATASGRAVEGEGLMGLARPLLGGGTRVVVASLWDVDDRSASRLLARFHEALVETQDPAEALRRAQLALFVETGRTDASGWAPFVVIGA